MRKRVALTACSAVAICWSRSAGRDLLVAIGTVAAVRAGGDASAVKVNLFCEATDSIALGEEIRVRGKIGRTTIIGAAFNLFGYFTWLRALRFSRAQALAASRPRTERPAAAQLPRTHKRAVCTHPDESATTGSSAAAMIWARSA